MDQAVSTGISLPRIDSQTGQFILQNDPVPPNGGLRQVALQHGLETRRMLAIPYCLRANDAIALVLDRGSFRALVLLLQRFGLIA